MAFDRAGVLNVLLDIHILATDGTDTDAVKAAIIARGPKTIGTTAVFEKLQAGVFDAAGVTDLVSFGLTTSPAGFTNENVVPDADTIVVIDSGDITVTID